jgi:hypothetical protein
MIVIAATKSPAVILSTTCDLNGDKQNTCSIAEMFLAPAPGNRQDRPLSFSCGPVPEY